MDYPLPTETISSSWFDRDAKLDARQKLQAAQAVKTLIARTVAGDGSAFAQLVTVIQGIGYRVAYQMLHSQEAAADAVQEALIKMFYALATFRGGNFKSWFLRILINTCYDLLRKQKAQAVTSLDALLIEPETAQPLLTARDSPERYLEQVEVYHWLEQGLAALPGAQRTMVVLYDVEGYSYNEIVAFTGVPIGTVKSRLSRGRSKLRDYLLRHNALPF